MAIKEMKLGDVQEVSKIVVAAFLDSVACELTQEGISTFKGLSSPEAFAKRMNEDNHMFVYEEQGEIMGMIELKEGRHVAMLFVSPAHQKRGIGKILIEAAITCRCVQTITVSASIPSVPAYQSYGFNVIGAEEEKQGLRYVPMQIVFNQTL